MPPTGTSADAARDRRRITSRKLRVGLEGPGATDDSLAVWAERYLTLAVRGARSAEVAGKITRHLHSFHAFLTAGLGHDRLSAVTPREVAAWREHLAATVVRTLADGRAQAMAPATVNNHLAHPSAFFTWTAAHAPTGLLPHGDPTARVALLRLPAPEPRALSAAQVRTVKNVLDRLDGFHRRTGRRHRAGQPGLHRHARPLRDRAIVHLLLGTGLRRAELVALDLAQLEPNTPEGLRRARRARLAGVRGKGRTPAGDGHAGLHRHRRDWPPVAGIGGQGTGDPGESCKILQGPPCPAFRGCRGVTTHRHGCHAHILH
jgi:site-specific recombinase XerD